MESNQAQPRHARLDKGSAGSPTHHAMLVPDPPDWLRSGKPIARMQSLDLYLAAIYVIFNWLRSVVSRIALQHHRLLPSTRRDSYMRKPVHMAEKPGFMDRDGP